MYEPKLLLAKKQVGTECEIRMLNAEIVAIRALNCFYPYPTRYSAIWSTFRRPQITVALLAQNADSEIQMSCKNLNMSLQTVSVEATTLCRIQLHCAVHVFEERILAKFVMLAQTALCRMCHQQDTGTKSLT